jgi:hypothetical protein
MNAENCRIFDLFRKARHKPVPRRAAIFAQTWNYRQTTLANLGLVLATMLNKV